MYVAVCMEADLGLGLGCIGMAFVLFMCFFSGSMLAAQRVNGWVDACMHEDVNW